MKKTTLKKVWMIAGLMGIACLEYWWLLPTSECERLVHAGQDEKAFSVCLGAAKQGDAYAENIMGVRYANGNGVEQDSGEALKWFHKSA